MIPRWPFPVLAAVLVLATSLAADDGYSIKLYELTRGDAVLIERVDVDEITLVTRDAAGKKLDEKRRKQVTTLVFWEQVLEKPEGAVRPTKLRRGFGTSTILVDGSEHKIGLAGKIVLIEQQEGRFRFFVDNKELTGNEADFLDKEFNRPGSQRPFRYDMILPGKPVKLNQAWDVDAATWTESLRAATGLDFVSEKVQSSGRLTKVEKLEGKQQGTLFFRLDAPIKSYRKEGKDLPVAEGGVLTLQVTLEAAIDGSQPYGKLRLSGATTFDAVMDVDGVKYTNTVIARNKREQAVKPHVRK